MKRRIFVAVATVVIFSVVISNGFVVLSVWSHDWPTKQVYIGQGISLNYGPDLPNILIVVRFFSSYHVIDTWLNRLADRPNLKLPPTPSLFRHGLKITA